DMGLAIYFAGQEREQYTRNMLGMSFINQVCSNVRMKCMLSRFENDEQERIDIQGAYLFGDREYDRSDPSYGDITNPLGAGVFHQYARNTLNIRNLNFSHRGYLDQANHHIQWGLSYDRTEIKDRLHEWEMQDSAGYNIPFDPAQLQMSKFMSGT